MNPNYTLRDTMTGDFTRPKAGPVNRSYGAILGQQPANMTREVSGQRNLQTTDINGA